MSTFAAIAALILSDPMTLLMTPDPEYKACIEKIRLTPDQGREDALQWVAAGGGAPAQHCAAMADLALKNYRIGAVRLLELADQEAAKAPLIAATLYGQAAEALLSLPDETTATQAVSIGLNLVPEAADLHVIAGRIHLSAQRWDQAEAALTKAATYQALDTRSFSLRARARIELSQIEPAVEDTLAALRLDPHNIDALVIRGELVQQGLTIDIPKAVAAPTAEPDQKPKSKRRLRGLR